jgi:hypothetical protein
MRFAALVCLFLATQIAFAADRLDVCACQPRDEKPSDYRYAAKHVPLPDMQPQTISLQDVLDWEQGRNPKNDAPRTGRELQLVNIPKAYVQFAWAYRGDCDIHIEVSATPDKDAPRVIVETPVDPEYCDARKAIQSALREHGTELSVLQQEVSDPFPVSVRGLPYQDFAHKRGSKHVATVWEIHPAMLQAVGDTSHLSPSDRRLVAAMRSSCYRAKISTTAR